ncbi:MAG: hypothetical protein MUC35_05200 [Candidatus Margulisbacteria bacterium]|jgi:hypothetical protein|nr:hypothetical protein [Candidatus Margulisiibacteriota bacterium]
MKLKTSNLPFVLVFISSLIPMACSLFNIPSIVTTPGLIFAAWGLSCLSLRDGRAVILSKHSAWAAFLAFLLLINIVTDRGFVILAAGGYILIFTFIFYDQLLTGVGASAQTIVSGISFLYKFYIMGMLVETVVIVLGKQPLLAELFNSVSSWKYKTYNPADVAHLIGLFSWEAGGLNSVLLGSQIAGMLSLFAFIWFIGTKYSGLGEIKVERSKLWSALSFAVLLIALNNTVFMMLVLAVIIYYLFIKQKQKLMFLIVMGLLFVSLYFLAAQGVLFGRTFSADNLVSANDVRGFSNGKELVGATRTELSLYIYFQPVLIWLSQDWLSKMIGVGAQYFRTTALDIPTDFGFFVDVVLKAGLIWAIIFVVTLLVICVPSLKLPKSGSAAQQQWARLRSINALISLLWLFSTLHYNQAMQNPPAIMLFALHLALVLYCDRRYRSLACNHEGKNCGQAGEGVRAI